MGILDGKVAVVTAATDGIGLAIAKRLAKDGAAVVVSSRKQTKVDQTVREIEADGGKVFGVVCHVGNAEHRKRLIKETISRYGGVDILVSNAAANPVFGPIFDATESAWDKIFDINLKATFFLCKEVFPLMAKRGGGAIILVGSIAGYRPRPQGGLYGTSKTAMLGLVKAMAPQCASSNVRVNNIAPGLFKTNFSSALWQNPDILEKTEAEIPLGRAGVPSECGGVASFLASDDASYITGETIVVSGGVSARL